MTNTTPLNEEDRLGEILERFMYSFTHLDDPMDLETAKQEITKLIQTLEKKARIQALELAIMNIQASPTPEYAVEALEQTVAQLEKGSE